MATNVTKLEPYKPSDYPTLTAGDGKYFTNEFRKIGQAIVSLQQVAKAGMLGVTKKAGLPTTADLPAGASGIFKDNTGGGIYLAYNDAGTVKTVQLGVAAPTSPTLTVATLPAAASNKGARYLVSDATATTFWTTVVGGGANIVPVTSDGTNWKIG